jgi:hypothetical protein
MEERSPIPETLIPPSVSHRQLAAMLREAPVEAHPEGAPSTAGCPERQAFEALLAEWGRCSHQLLAALSRGDRVVMEGRSQRQLMALGALQAHLAMGLQAHAAATGPQPD